MHLPEPELPILDDDLVDDEAVTAGDIGWSIDLAREDLEDTDDGIGFRTLFERPEIALRRRSRRWPHAAWNRSPIVP